MPKRRKRSRARKGSLLSADFKKKHSHKFWSIGISIIVVLSVIFIADLGPEGDEPSGQFFAAGKSYTSVPDYYAKAGTVIVEKADQSCVSISKKSRWRKKSYYKALSKKFYFGKRYSNSEKGKTKAMRKAKTYASEQAIKNGANCWKYGSVVGIGKRGCMKLSSYKKDTTRKVGGRTVKTGTVSYIRFSETSGKSWKKYRDVPYSIYYDDEYKAYKDAVTYEKKLKTSNDVSCVLDEWTGWAKINKHDGTSVSTSSLTKGTLIINPKDFS